MSEPHPRPDDTLDLSLTRRLREVVSGSAATEGELRLLSERGDALRRTLEASIGSSDAYLSRLASEPGAALAEMASELRRLERLRAELAELLAALRGLDERARALRGEWLKGS